MGSSYPETRREMLRARYQLIYSRPCSRCGQPTDRWRTTHGAEITMDAGTEHQKVCRHDVTCVAAQRERKRRGHEATAIYRFARLERATAVVLLGPDGSHQFVVDPLQEPADMHTALVAAADAVRDHLVHLNEMEQA